MGIISVALAISLLYLRPPSNSSGYSKYSGSNNSIQVVLAPLKASVRGLHCQVRNYPQPHILFFHKSNSARWKLPVNALIPGSYTAWTQVARRGPTWTSLYAGISIDEEDKDDVQWLVPKTTDYFRENL